MANEYKLSYTAEEINNKLEQVSQLSEAIVNLKSSGIVIVQDGNTLTVNSGGAE